MTTETTELNTRLLYDLIDWADREDRGETTGLGGWNQGSWALTDRWRTGIDTGRNVCGTAYCIAGQAVLQAGYRMVWSDDEAYECIKVEEDSPNHYRPASGASPEDISAVATEVLGIDADEADDLFDGCNSISMLKRIANAIADRRGIPLLFDEEGL